MQGIQCDRQAEYKLDGDTGHYNHAQYLVLAIYSVTGRQNIYWMETPDTIIMHNIRS